jgi:hypothetical protein
METTRYTVDKTSWERGPWDDEPDLENLTTAEGFDALVFRASWSGNFCGYVGVPPGHPWYGKEYGASVKITEKQATEPVDIDRVSVISLLAMSMYDSESDDLASIDCIIRVHGGLTYSGFGRERFGEKPDHWYFGFDCAHAGDLSPAYASKYGLGYDDQYRDVDYVRREIADLSRQLAEVAK